MFATRNVHWWAHTAASLLARRERSLRYARCSNLGASPAWAAFVSDGRSIHCNGRRDTGGPSAHGARAAGARGANQPSRVNLAMHFTMTIGDGIALLRFRAETIKFDGGLDDRRCASCPV